MDNTDKILNDAMTLLREWEKEFWIHPEAKVRNPDVVELERRIERLSERTNG